jgi:primosomal protein N' (replication factor Y)
MGGNVIIQTYSPEHFAIEAAAKHNYLEFYNMEIKNRRELNYPPFSKLTLITVSAPQEAKVISKIKELAAKYPQEKVLGPVPSPIKKIRGFYRWQFLLKNQEINYLDFPEKSDVKIDIDVDPINIY